MSTKPSLVVSPDKKSRKRKPKTKGSDLEDMLYLHIQAARLPLPKRQWKFAPKRRFLFDFAWPDLMIAIEVEGGIWTGGRHIRPAGFVKDIEKYNLACLLSWRVFRCTSKMVRDGTALTLIEQALATHSLSLSS